MSCHKCTRFLRLTILGMKLTRKSSCQHSLWKYTLRWLNTRASRACTKSVPSRFPWTKISLSQFKRQNFKLAADSSEIHVCIKFWTEYRGSIARTASSLQVTVNFLTQFKADKSSMRLRATFKLKTLIRQMLIKMMFHARTQIQTVTKTIKMMKNCGLRHSALHLPAGKDAFPYRKC